MALHAWLQDGTESGGKAREPRRRVLLDGAGTTPSGAVIAVTVHNISATGMLIECDAPLNIDDKLWMDLPESANIGATVVWTSGALYGCKFSQPLSRSTLSAALLKSAVGVPGDALAGAASKRSDAGEPLGVRLRRLRKARGMTLSDLAAELGVSKPTVWAWEQGRSAPTQDRHEKIAQVLETSVASLRTGVDGDAAMAVIERSRQQIAESFGTDPDKIRIMIEL